MFPVIQLGPLAIQAGGLILIAGLWLGLALAERYASKSGVEADILYQLTFIAVAVAALGGRFVYVARYPAEFIASPMSVISLNPGLLDPWGAFATATIGGLIYLQRKHIPLWAALDGLTPTLAVLSFAVGLSHLATGQAFGAPTGSPLTLHLWGANRHPTQVYEMLAAGLIWLAVRPGYELFKPACPGDRFLVWAALSAASTLFIEGLRADSLLLPGGFRTVQILAWIGLATALIVFRQRRPAVPASGS
jgi:phosphatidylglycerol:prolipoprotein diacylglycerol transferase